MKIARSLEIFNPPKHVLILGEKTWFYAEGEVFKLSGCFFLYFCLKIRKIRFFFSIRMILQNFSWFGCWWHSHFVSQKKQWLLVLEQINFGIVFQIWPKHVLCLPNFKLKILLFYSWVLHRIWSDPQKFQRVPVYSSLLIFVLQHYCGMFYSPNRESVSNIDIMRCTQQVHLTIS